MTASDFDTARQAVIPVPVVGALIGGVVGQVGAAMVQQGIRVAVVGRADNADWDEGYDDLLLEAAATELRSERQRESLAAAAQSYDTAFSELVMPRLERIGDESFALDVDVLLADLADLTRLYASTPLFTSMADFDAFMVDDDLVLNLRLGG